MVGTRTAPPWRPRHDARNRDEANACEVVDRLGLDRGAYLRAHDLAGFWLSDPQIQDCITALTQRLDRVGYLDTTQIRDALGPELNAWLFNLGFHVQACY